MTARSVRALLGLAAVAAGCSGESDTGGKPLHRPGNFDPSIAGYVACSRLIVSGEVLDVSDADAPDRMRTRLRVADWVKPTAGPRVTTIETADIARDGVYRRWQPGTHLFLVVDVDPAALPEWQFRAGTIAAIRRAVPEARTLGCPYCP